MPDDPNALVPVEIAVVQNEEGAFLVRVTFPPTEDDETPVVTLSGEAAMLLGRSIVYAAYVAKSGQWTAPTEAQA
jgi:hypothetical protein